MENTKEINSRAWWLKLIAEWKASGKTQEAFCTERQISVWALRSRCKSTYLRTEQEHRFVEIPNTKKQVDLPSEKLMKVAVLFPSGIRVEISPIDDIYLVLSSVARL